MSHRCSGRQWQNIRGREGEWVESFEREGDVWMAEAVGPKVGGDGSQYECEVGLLVNLA